MRFNIKEWQDKYLNEGVKFVLKNKKELEFFDQALGIARQFRGLSREEKDKISDYWAQVKKGKVEPITDKRWLKILDDAFGLLASKYGNGGWDDPDEDLANNLARRTRGDKEIDLEKRYGKR